jgi:predicted nucleic acid-binding protein
MYLLDTVVLSELRKRDRHAGLVSWRRRGTPDELFLSSITIGEIERGIARERTRHPVFAD